MLARATLAVAGWLAPGLAIGALVGLPDGLVATMPLHAAGVSALALQPRLAWAASGAGLALAFAAIPIVALLAALGGPFAPGGPPPDGAAPLAALAWVAGLALVGTGRVGRYPWPGTA